MAVKQRRKLANYLEVDNAYEYMGSGFTDLNESPSAQTTKKRYVNDKSSSTSITGYEWQMKYTTDVIKTQKPIDFIVNIGEMQLMGADAETNTVIVDLDEPAMGDNEFKARKIKVAVEVSDFDNNDGEVTVSGNLLGIGDPVLGTFNTTTRTFKEGFNEKTLEFSYTATGTITNISIAGITYNTTTHKFIGIPYDTITLTFKDNAVDKTATLTNSWAVA